MGDLYGDDLFDAAVFERPVRRPIWKAAGFAAIVALSLWGLYQGYRFTFRDYGPAPRYPQMISTQAPVAPAGAPDAQAASADTAQPDDRSKLELADNDAAAPSPTDGSLSAPGRVAPIVPVDRAALIPSAGAEVQQGVTFDQPAPASPAYGDPAPGPPPQ